VGEYVLRVVNWLAAGPDEITPGKVEAWTLTCERPDGVPVARKLVIGRGDSQTLRPCAA
jgi:hypothetical protein